MRNLQKQLINLSKCSHEVNLVEDFQIYNKALNVLVQKLNIDSYIKEDNIENVTTDHKEKEDSSPENKKKDDSEEQQLTTDMSMDSDEVVSMESAEVVSMESIEDVSMDVSKISSNKKLHKKKKKSKSSKKKIQFVMPLPFRLKSEILSDDDNMLNKSIEEVKNTEEYDKENNKEMEEIISNTELDNENMEKSVDVQDKETVKTFNNNEKDKEIEEVISNTEVDNENIKNPVDVQDKETDDVETILNPDEENNGKEKQENKDSNNLLTNTVTKYTQSVESNENDPITLHNDESDDDQIIKENKKNGNDKENDIMTINDDSDDTIENIEDGILLDSEESLKRMHYSDDEIFLEKFVSIDPNDLLLKESITNSNETEEEINQKKNVNDEKMMNVDDHVFSDEESVTVLLDDWPMPSTSHKLGKRRMSMANILTVKQKKRFDRINSIEAIDTVLSTDQDSRISDDLSDKEECLGTIVEKADLVQLNTEQKNISV